MKRDIFHLLISRLSSGPTPTGAIFGLAGPGFLAGTLLLLILPDLPHWGWGGVSAILSCVFLLRRRWLPAWIAFGFCWTFVYVTHAWHPLDQTLEGRNLEVVGVVDDFAVNKKGGWRFEFRVLKEIHGRQVPSRIRLSWYGGPRVSSGQKWHLTVRLKSPRGFQNPGGFDYERWLFARRIGALGYVVRRGKHELLAEAGGLTAVRQQLADAIDTRLGGLPMRGILKALTLGARDGIDSTQWQVLRATGTAHLIAISGLHIGLVAGVLLLVSRRIGLFLNLERRQLHRGAALICWLGALAYAALAGFSLPTQRALIMLTLGLAAWLWQRQPSPWRSLSLALLGVCLWDPLAPLGAGFWLSFVAVGWIFLGAAGRLRSLPAWLSTLQIQGALLLGLAPLLAWFFSQVGWTAPLANGVAVPIVGFLVVPLALTACMVWWIDPRWAGLLWHLAARVMEAVWMGLEWLFSWGQGSWHQSPSSLAAVILALLGVALLILPRGLPGRWLGGLLLLPMLLPEVSRPLPGELWLTVLDVGQGLAVVAETAGHVLVYDTGPYYSEHFDAGSDIVTPFLRQRGWQRLDRVIVSHADRDHSGGLPGLHRVWNTEVLTSIPIALAGIPTRPCRAGQVWVWDEVTFQILWPEMATRGAENDRSCVLKIETRAGSVLLPGDIETPAEALLVVKYGESLRSHVLVAPHHGSATSSSWDLLKAVQPRLVLISSGYRNRFGFPSARNLDRYLAMDAIVFNTANSGALEVRMGPGVQITEHRGQNRRLWSWKAR